jgi:hypothetical protein
MFVVISSGKIGRNTPNSSYRTFDLDLYFVYNFSIMYPEC